MEPTIILAIIDKTPNHMQIVDIVATSNSEP